MQKIKVTKNGLLYELKRNMHAHSKAFEKAIEGYRQVVIELLDDAIKNAKAGSEIRTYFDIEQPRDHTKEYKRAISMLEWSVDEEVELTEQQFSQYVQDDWGWKPDFLNVSASYSTSASISKSIVDNKIKD